ncbi:DGAT1/2-independent enzyme synthesizing storage lipids-like [Lineus longissimus]|uniref:DGAT1/2-independent enzyme synthesizing storage lipids-like n=1 Tax=Lineus longissimus TaxID=88925 RepID=UPI002B4F91CF
MAAIAWCFHLLPNGTEAFYDDVVEMLALRSSDWHYLAWIVWLLYPIIISFLLPVLLVIFLYASALFLVIYRQRHRLKDAYQKNFWDGAKNTLAAIWDGHGRVWHGYEVDGFDNIPNEGPVLIIYYHGTIPIDVYYLMARLILHKNRQLQCVGDRFLFKIPGFRILMEVFCVTPGTVQSGIELMKEGHLLAISPGGTRECLFGDLYYNMMWGKRVGFAKIALAAKVPIIPMFTQNCREAFRSVEMGKSWFRKIYEKTRLPLIPVYGGLPVKLKTFIGAPIYCDADMTPEQVSHKVQTAVYDLIQTHQKVPGSILRSLLDRFNFSKTD